MKTIHNANIENKTVFLRVDWNVPLKDGEIADDNRIRATVPTFEFLRSKNCKIIVGAHLGRPDGEIVPSLSTKPLAKRLSKYLPTKILATDEVIETPVKSEISRLRSGEVLVLGNLRWHQEEETNSSAFARILASYADIYVNDAFAVCHRAHASVEAITKYLPSFAGLLLEKEVTSLSLLIENPRHPFVVVLGGAKIKDKIGIIKKFADMADKVLVGGAIACTLLYFKGMNVSQSLIEPKAEHQAEEIFKILAHKLVLPVDNRSKDLGGGAFSILDIGPKTIEIFKSEILPAKTIFWNGNLGYSEDENFAAGTFEIAEAIRNNSGVKIVAGGDTDSFLSSHKITHGFSFISTGGGAAEEFLAGEKLPALAALGYYD